MRINFIKFLYLLIRVPKFGFLFFSKFLLKKRKFLFGSQNQIKFFKRKIYFDLKLNDWIQCQIYFLNKYEDFELNVVSELLNDGDIFIDVGANFGLYSLWCGSLVGSSGKVISFEPFDENLIALKRNLSLNKLSNVIIVDKAISDKNCKVNIYYNENEQNLGMVSTFNFDNGISKLVNTTSLDYYLNENRIESLKLIKIDIEGGEYLALLGMIETLKYFSPVVQLEIDESILKMTPYSGDDIYSFFKKIGYELYTPQLTNKNQSKRSLHSKNYYFKSILN
jgi:FkbM family methyltransferase